eukprot:symbB.v1.2.025397.t1/scaffold2448.1/size78896/4
MNLCVGLYAYQPILYCPRQGADNLETQVLEASPAPTDVGPVWRSDGELPPDCGLDAELVWATRNVQTCRGALFKDERETDPTPIDDAEVKGEEGKKNELGEVRKVDMTEVVGVATEDDLKHGKEEEDSVETKESEEKKGIEEQKQVEVEGTETTKVTTGKQEIEDTEGEKKKTTSEKELMANIKFSTGRSLLDVKAETWVTQEERKEQLRMAKCRVQVPKEPVEMPEVPKSFGKEKEREEPPKKRPKSDPVVAEPKKKRQRKGEATAENKPAEVETLAPSKRLRKYLQDQKDKKGESKKKGVSSESHAKSPMTAEDKKKLEQKQKLSRKSSAYHVAYKKTEGSVEEKKAAARKVLLAIILLLRFTENVNLDVQFTMVEYFSGKGNVSSLAGYPELSWCSPSLGSSLWILDPHIQRNISPVLHQQLRGFDL